jgi:hypothetical protein
MPSFLTTKKMGPRLRERIHVSLTGRRKETRRARVFPLLVACLRAAMLIGLVVFAVSFFLRKHDQETQIAAMRARVIAAHEKESSGLSKRDKQLRQRTEEAITEGLGRYKGDFFSHEVRDQDLFLQLLKQPGVYLRGSLRDLNKEAGIQTVAQESLKDAFLVCLLDPPVGVEERDLLERVYVAYRSGPTLDQATAPFFRLQAGLAFMPLLEDAWRDNVRRATKLQSLQQLLTTLERAPLEQAKAAARAETILFVIDEDKEAGAPSEFDGSNKHFARVHLVKLGSQSTLLRARLLVDPSWISEKRRHQYASGLLGCRLAKELHQVLLGRKTDEGAERGPGEGEDDR